jgi:hypothetical protein
MGGCRRNVEQQYQRADEKTPLGADSVDFHVERVKALHDASAAFAIDFPQDSHGPQALIWKWETTILPESPDERVALLQQNEKDAQNIVDNHAIPANLRFDAERTILDQWLDNPDLITTAAQAAQLDQRIDSYLSKNPAEPRVRSLQLARAGLLLRADRQKGIAFLDTLSHDEDSKLASAAKAKLADIELVGKPLDLSFTSTQGDAVNLQNDFHGKGWDNEISTRFGISSIPTMWLIDQNGRLATTEFPIGELDAKVVDLLGRSASISRR